MSTYLPGAEPLYIEGNSMGCLLLHGGGGGTAWDLKEFAQLLHEQTGMTIWLPSLTGFGTQPEDLLGITLDDWLHDAESGVDKLLRNCERVFVVGHSAGGVLALLTASKRKEIKGLVTWSAPYRIKMRLLSVLGTVCKIPLLRRAIPKMHESTAPRWLKEQGWVGYDQIPTSIGLVMLEGLKRLKNSLNRVRCPALIIQGTEDDSITKDSAERILKEISSKKKEMVLIKGAHHPMMNEAEHKDELFTRSIEFLSSLQ